MPRRKTKEEYLEELRVKNPHVQLIGDYINARTKVLHYCTIHDVFWETTPDKVLRGCGCKQCGIEQARRSRLKPKQQYVEELSVKNPNVILIDEYVNTHTPVAHYCKIHSITFNIRPYDALQGKGCYQCKSEKISVALAKTREQYVEELSIKNPTVQLIGEYKGTNTSTEHYCLIHDVIWNMEPANALYGQGCPKCKSDKITSALRKSEDEYIAELCEKNPNLILSGTYINYRTPVEHYCKTHDVFFNISPLSALRGAGCRQCGSEKLQVALTKSQEEYINELSDVNPYVVLIGEYTGACINTPHKCLKCGCEWNPKPNDVLHGSGCPSCTQSKGEQKVRLWLEKNELTYESQKRFDNCRDKLPLPFDFYLEYHNACIEYQGVQHYESVGYFGGEKALVYTQYHDKIKKDYCDSNNIYLICIPYWENVDDYLNKNLLI